jgi:hypothetical protein
VTLDPTSAPIGVGIGQMACPAGYGTAIAIMAGLNPGTCSGCSCQPGPVVCTTNLSGFQTIDECLAAKPGEPAGGWKTGAEGPSCTVIPPWVTSGTGDIYGVATTPFLANPSGCTPGGTPTYKAPTWTASAMFCTTSTVGGGCGNGRVCVPVAQASICQIFDGAHTCPMGTQEGDWYTGYSGAQSCGACSCGPSSGASCANVSLSIGSDFVCGSQNGTVGSGSRVCLPNGAYQPGVNFVGTPTPGTCPAQSVVGGSLTPTGRKTVCCLP